MCLQPHRAPVLVRLQPCGLCPGAQGRRTAGFGSSKLLESASICRVWSGRCLSRPGCCLSRAVRFLEGLATSPRRQQPCPPWAGAAAGALGWERGWPQASRRSCGHPVVALAAQSWSPRERYRAAPDPWWSSAELQERLPSLEESLRWRGAQVGRSSPSLGSCFCNRGPVLFPTAGLFWPGWIPLPFSRCHEIEYHLRL